MLLGKGGGYWSAQATLCNLVQSSRLQGKRASWGKPRASYNLTKHSLLLPASSMSYSSGYPPKTHLLHLTRLHVEGRNFSGLFLWCLLTSSGGGGAVHRCQLSCHSSGGEGEKIGKPFSKDFNQSNCVFRSDDKSLGCVSMFELFWSQCPPLGELRKLFCCGDDTAQFVGSPACPACLPADS